MKSSFIASVLALSVQVSSFPTNVSPELLERYAKPAKDDTPRVLLEKRQRKNTPIGFDAKSQYVSTTGQYAFKPPNFEAGDQRGPCPGLNALANHGYLPHSGVALGTTFVKAVNEVYGMSFDLGGFLAIYGTAIDGNALGYSIGGPVPDSSFPGGNVLGLAGHPQGLSGSHNKYESDASPTRGDLYLNGDNYKVQVSQFQQYHDALEEGISSIDQYDKLLDYRVARFKHSVANNPDFFYPPFAGILVSPAGFSFPAAMMANHSEEFPEGSLTKEQLKSFFAISGKSGNFEYKVGHERIPDNWYKRAIGDEYSVAGFLADVLDFGIKYPPFLDVAGNTGKPNTLTGVDLYNLTGGVFNTASLAKGNNLECFVFQSINIGAPDAVAGLYHDPKEKLTSLTSKIAARLAGLACPKLEKLDQSQYNKYPGYRKSGGAV